MIVTMQNLDSQLERFSASGKYGIDTETTGLLWKDRLFSIILSDEAGAVYFNFNKFDNDRLPCSVKQELQRCVFSNPCTKWFAHNAKFDMLMLSKEDCELWGEVHDTMIVARLIYNQHLRYSLDACASRDLGEEKDTSVEEYIKQHRLYDIYEQPGKKTKIRAPRFDKVPLEIVSKYAEKDAVLTRKLGLFQETIIDKENLYEIYKQEATLLKNCIRIERRGVRIDKEYTKEALESEVKKRETATAEFILETGRTTFVDSAKALSDVLYSGDERGLPKTSKGQIRIDKKSIAAISGKVGQIVNRIREHDKLANTYYNSFLFYGGEEGIIHASMRQSGTDTGRFSYSDPNLQNVPKEVKEGYDTRRCFIPRHHYCYLSLDYDQQEFRMMLDYAGQMDIIKKVLEGEDVHQSTATLMGVDRKTAKTLNFGLLYGMGVKKLAIALGISIAEAQDLKNRYYSRFPKIKLLSRVIADTAKARGYIRTWAGRKLILPKLATMPSIDLSYKMTNHLIQGGCADVCKQAINRVSEMLVSRKLKSEIVIQVHDELLFEIHDSELDIAAEIKNTMENIYPTFNGCRLTVSAEYSWESWCEKTKKEGLPQIAA